MLGLILRSILLTASISITTLVNSDPIIEQNRLAPQPATPPKPSFDQYDHHDQVQVDNSPPKPFPATPPKLDSRAKPHFDNRYEGKEYRFKKFVIRPAQLRLEAFLLINLIIYVIISYRGKRKNEIAVTHWLDTYSQLMQKEFSHVGHGLPQGYIANGPALFYSYATGRKGCQSLTISFALRPRQDIPYMIYEELRAAIDLSWTGRSDRIELVWALSPNNSLKNFESKDSFVWGLVDKRVMNLLREDRWDVRTFTEIKESNQLPSQLVFMSESGEINEQIIKNKDLGFAQLLQKNPSCLQWFDSLVLSGSPQEEPLISELPIPTVPSIRTLTLRLRLPPPTDTLDTLPLLEFSFNLINLLDRSISLTSITATKLVKKRTEISNLLVEEERKIQKRSKEDERRKRIKAAQNEKFANMTPTEQRKFDERERKRNAAKISKTTVKRK